MRSLWLGLLVTACTAVLVFAPLGLFFVYNPGTFFSRTGDVAFSADSPVKVAGHLFQAISLFLGAGHELYRHHLPGRAMLGWLEIPFFWLGLIWLLRPSRLRHPESHLILLGLGVMWLPALLASPPVHSLRPIGLLPFYYLIVTLGLDVVAGGKVAGSRVAGSRVASSRVAGSKVAGSRVASSRVIRSTLHAPRSTLYALRFLLYASRFIPIVIIALNGLINTYDYFQRWANHPEMYQEYNGPLVDLSQHLIDLTQTHDVIIPFHLYVHPTTRYLLQSALPEREGPPPVTGRPVEMLLIPSTFQLLYVGNIPESPALVLLTRDTTGQGATYVSRLPRAAEQVAINQLLASLPTQPRPFRDRLDRTVAQFVTLADQNSQPIHNLFDFIPLRTINLNWANLARLEGYEVTPELAQPGQAVTLNFYWHSLTDQTFEYRLFLQLIDRTGHPVTQWEGDAFREDMYRWRPAGILPTQHTLWLGPDTPPGPYLVRMGFFDDSSGQRLPVRMGEWRMSEWRMANGSVEDEADTVDQVQLGLFYVSPDGTDPRQPAVPLSANFADAIKLIGVTLPEIENAQLKTQNLKLKIVFHWKVIHPTTKPYTVFLQLLNQQGEVISGWDSQPFNGLYPTNLWSPGERIADTFLLPLPEGGLPPGSYRLITGFYDFDTGQRLPVVGAGDFAEMAEFVVGNRE